MKEKDGKIYKKVFSAKPGEVYTRRYLDGTVIKKKIEVLTQEPRET